MKKDPRLIFSTLRFVPIEDCLSAWIPSVAYQRVASTVRAVRRGATMPHPPFEGAFCHNPVLEIFTTL